MDQDNGSLPFSQLLTPSNIIIGTVVAFSAGVLSRLAYDWTKESIRTRKAKKISK